MKAIRKVLCAVLAAVMFASVAFAGDITATGMEQKDLYALLSALVAAVNELKTDLNATLAKMDVDFTAARDNVATLDNNYTATNPASFTTIVLTPRAGY